MFRQIPKRSLSSHSVYINRVSSFNRLFSSLTPSSVKNPSRCVGNIGDLNTGGLYDVLNKSKILKLKCSLHNPYPQSTTNYPKEKPLENVNICLLTAKAVPVGFTDINLVRVLELCGAKVTTSTFTDFAKRQRAELKKNGTTVPEDATPVSLAADYISSHLSRSAVAQAQAKLTEPENSETKPKSKRKSQPLPEPVDLVLGIYTAPSHAQTHKVLAQRAGVPVLTLHSPDSALLSVLGLLQACHVVTPSMFNAKVGFVGSGNTPFVYDLSRAAQMLQFGMTVSSPRRLMPKKDVVDSILAATHERPVTGEELPASVFEVVEHPFIACAQADFIVTDTVVPHTTWKGKPSHPLAQGLDSYEVDKEMLSVGKDTARLGHVTSGMHDWLAPPLGADDARCLWSMQLSEENYALVSLCMWALDKQFK